MEENLDVCYEAIKVSFYDKFNYFAPVHEGLLGNEVLLYLSSEIRNIVDNEEV